MLDSNYKWIQITSSNSGGGASGASVVLENWNEEKTIYLTQLEELFEKFTTYNTVSSVATEKDIPKMMDLLSQTLLQDYQKHKPQE